MPRKDGAAYRKNRPRQCTGRDLLAAVLKLRTRVRTREREELVPATASGAKTRRTSTLTYAIERRPKKAVVALDILTFDMVVSTSNPNRKILVG
jgi:hypothetical protein